MRRTEALQGVRMSRFLNILRRYEAAELNQKEAAELLGVERADVPAVARTIRGGRRSGAFGPPARQGVGQAGSGRPGGRRWSGFIASATRASRSSISTSIWSRTTASAWGYTWLKTASAMEGRCWKAPRKRGASEEARAAADAGHDAASGRLAPRMARGPAGASI